MASQVSLPQLYKHQFPVALIPLTLLFPLLLLTLCLFAALFYPRLFVFSFFSLFFIFFPPGTNTTNCTTATAITTVVDVVSVTFYFFFSFPFFFPSLFFSFRRSPFYYIGAVVLLRSESFSPFHYANPSGDLEKYDMESKVSLETISSDTLTSSCDLSKEDHHHVRDLQACGDICDRFRPPLVKSESLDTGGQNLGPITRYRLLTDSRKSPPLQWRPTLRRADTLDACPNPLRNMHYHKQAYDEAYPCHKPWPTLSRNNSPVMVRSRLSDYRQLHRSYPDHSMCNHPVVETKNVATSTSPPPHDITDQAFDLELPIRSTYKPSLVHSPNPTHSPPLNNSPHHHPFSKGTQRISHQGPSVMANKTTSPIPFHQMCYGSSRSSPRNLMQTSPLMRPCTSKSPSPQPLMRVMSQDSTSKPQPLQSPLQKMKGFTTDKSPVYSLHHQHHQQQHSAHHPRHHNHASAASPIPPLSPPINSYRNQDYQTAIMRSQTVSSPQSPQRSSSPRWNFISELSQRDLMPTSLVRAQTISSGSSPFYRPSPPPPPSPPQFQGLENRQSAYVRHTRSAQSTPLSASRLLHGGPMVAAAAAATAVAAAATATADSTPTSINHHPNHHIYNYSANLLTSSSNGSSPAHPNIHLRQQPPHNLSHRLADNQGWRSKHMSYPSAEYVMSRKRDLRTGSLVDPADNSDTSEDLNSSSSDASICRICHEGESTAELISPCYCTGSMGKLHVTCLERWLGSSYMNRCEICGYEYLVLRKPKPFIEFLKNPGTQNEKRHLMCDILCFFMLTPLAGVSIWLCLVGAEFFLQWEARWEVPGLACLAVFLLIIYIVWCTVAFRCQYRIWTEWKCRNQTVQIKSVSEDKRSLPAIISNRGNNSNPPIDAPASLGPNLPMWCTLSSQTILPHPNSRRRVSSTAADAASTATTTTTTAAAVILPVPPPPPPPEPTPPPHTPCSVTTTTTTNTSTSNNSNTASSFSFSPSPSPKGQRVPPQQLAINTTTSAPTHRREFGRVKVDLTQGSVGSCPGGGRWRRDSPHESVLSSSGTLGSNNYELHLWQQKCEGSLEKPIRHCSLVNNLAM